MLTGDSVSVSGNTSEHTGVDHQDEDVKTILGFVPSIYWLVSIYYIAVVSIENVTYHQYKSSALSIPTSNN